MRVRRRGFFFSFFTPLLPSVWRLLKRSIVSYCFYTPDHKFYGADSLEHAQLVLPTFNAAFSSSVLYVHSNTRYLLYRDEHSIHDNNHPDPTGFPQASLYL